MTDKQSFLDRLNAALIERGLSDEDIRPYMERFDRFYDRMVSDPNQISAEALNDIDTIADNIAAQVAERNDEITRLAERTMTVNAVKEEPEEEYELVEDAPTGLVPVDEMDTAETAEAEAVVTDEDIDALEEIPQDDGTSNRLPDYVEKEPIPNSTMFWVLFGVSLPVTIPLALAGLGIFAAVWIALIGLILASVAVLIAMVAAGSAVSLVGIIYGIIQLFSVVSVGLYEIGAGVIVAGVVMFAGILLYNFAVRLMPLIIRLVGRLFKFVIKKLVQLFNYLRRECAKL
ncbi:MAG: hypothetical protein E7632_01235 [Ruminococcaceae bacterium]|nr:hypothetical protein [Oscillospiraceae bacterium]